MISGAFYYDVIIGETEGDPLSIILSYLIGAMTDGNRIEEDNQI